MKQHQEIIEEQSMDAAQVRVRAEELARAVTAIEARRQEEARRRVGTVALGEAVQELQLDVTPEELLAEVKAQQERHSSGTQTPVDQTWADTQCIFPTTIKIIGSLVGAFLVLAWLASFNTHPVAPVTHSFTPPPPVTEPVSVAPGMSPAGAASFAAAPYHPLSVIREGQPFGCSFFTLDQILSQTPQSQILLYDEEAHRVFDENVSKSWAGTAPGPYLRSSWTGIKYADRIYVRGWVSGRPHGPQAPEQVLHVFNSPDVDELGEHPAQITLNTDGLKYEGMYMRLDNPLYHPSYLTPSQRPFYQHLAQEIAVSHVHLDQHAWEKW